jgi:hypothetical protein
MNIDAPSTENYTKAAKTKKNKRFKGAPFARWAEAA